MNAIAVADDRVLTPDEEGAKAFKHFEVLLSRVQRGAMSRRRGAELRAAKKEYAAYLPILQPIGQAMLDRAIDALEGIRARLQVPEGYEIIDSDYASRRDREFIAGQFQLNEDVSLYIRPKGKPTDETFGAEIRLFTRDVRAYVPAWVGRGPVTGRDVQLSGGAPFFKADSYDALADQIVVQVQAAMDSSTVCMPMAAMPPRPADQAASKSEE